MSVRPTWPLSSVAVLVEGGKDAAELRLVLRQPHALRGSDELDVVDGPTLGRRAEMIALNEDVMKHILFDRSRYVRIQMSTYRLV